MASIVIGVLLVGVAIVLARETRDLLVGEAAEPELSAGVRRLVMEDDAVSGVGRTLTMHVGPDDVLVNLDLTLRAGLGARYVADAMSRLERVITQAHPRIRYLFMETAAIAIPENRSTGETLMPESLLDDDVYASCLERIHRLAPDTRPRWGRMSVAQMLAHSAEVQEVMNGKPLEGTPWLFRLAGPLIKRAVLSRRPYPKGVRTHPQYLQTSEKHFEPERRRLLKALAEFRATGAEGARHPLFGPLSAEEAGWGAFKHLDHHLRQFGA